MKYNKNELKVLKKYGELAFLNPEVKTDLDLYTYIFVKIMFEHPLLDGNKRLACKYLLSNLGVREDIIENICHFLAKEIR